MAATAKQAITPRRSAPATERQVLYRGLEIPPIAGKRSPLAEAIRDAPRAQSESAGGEPTHA